eukprot:2835576-Heterocapsa_arctica.AAC.1
MTLKRSWFVVKVVVFGKHAMTQLSVPPMDSIPVFTMAQAAVSCSGLNAPSVPAAMSRRLAGGRALARSVNSVALFSLASCSEKNWRSVGEVAGDSVAQGADQCLCLVVRR